MTGIAQQQPAPPAPPPAPMPPILENYKPVTADRLKKPEDSDWLMIRRTYDGWGYSPLDQITPGNVNKLQPVWVFSTGMVSGHEAPPIINNGVMFAATPGNQVIAVEGKTGRILWRFRRPAPEGSLLPHQTSRGVALYGDKVFFAAGEAVLIAIDAKTGKEVWATTVADNKSGYYMTLAPLVADGKVLVGASGGEFGIRGFVAAFDPDTGKEVWRVYTVPAPGEPGSDTWPGGDQWKNGGASVWVTGNYDTETNLAFWGTGNGGPWMGDQRPGDNLYISSTIAIDVATGTIKGHHQYDPNESWDWDEVSPPILVDYKRGGRTIKGLIDVGRDGYLWFLERSSGKISFVEGKPFVRQNVYKSLDPETGRPQVDPDRKPGTGKMADFCPSLWGGKNWPPIAFSPKTRMIYIPANENICGNSIGLEVQYVPGRGFTGSRGNTYLLPEADHIGEVQAWDVDTGKKVWTHNYARSQNWGPMLATGGGLVFSGGTNDRMFHAFDAKNGKLLWEFPTNSGITGQPSSFMVDGKQYIAVQSGWGVDANGMQGVLNRGRPGEFPEVPQGGAIWVFAVK
ncbi:MAG: PQQ-dependent dehydrogenase, methanol/ethanol family [Acidobacteria bacterium]|nr:MAG: PQQ-dependent dehydrogenase, methanol/ethanol family [Acidobacteriota bacterium]